MKQILHPYNATGGRLALRRYIESLGVSSTEEPEPMTPAERWENDAPDREYETRVDKELEFLGEESDNAQDASYS